MGNPTQPQKRSKDLVVVVAVIVVVGLVAAIGWTKYRANIAWHQDDSVLSNLTFIRVAADAYFRDHPGFSSVTYADLVGTNPTQYLHNFGTVAQETYNPVIVQGAGFTAMGVAGARTITFGP
jgi:type II secretory pathway pseudopilin PulG